MGYKQSKHNGLITLWLIDPSYNFEHIKWEIYTWCVSHNITEIHWTRETEMYFLSEQVTMIPMSLRLGQNSSSEMGCLHCKNLLNHISVQENILLLINNS